MFDTGQASRVLEFPKYSLAYLLEKYCSIDADKKYQLADWRVRPLPPSLKKYAREDTHYLLWIFDKLRKALLSIDSSLLKTVWNRSRDICLRKYRKEPFESDGAMMLCDRFSLTDAELDENQLSVFNALYEWRDRIARKFDESINYVLPNDVLWDISLIMPSDAQSLLTCCKPLPIPVKENAEELVQLIQKEKMEKFNCADYLNSSIAHMNSRYYFSADSASFRPPYRHYTNNSMNHFLKPPNTPEANKSLRDIHSPVLSTDQLYKHAQWTEDKTSTQFSLMPSKRAVEVKMKEEIYFRGGQISLDLYDNDNDMDFEEEYGDDDLTMDAKSIRKTAAALCNAFVGTDEKNMIYLADVSETEEIDDDNEKGELESIPNSMDEIYKLSNRTRKLKKNKKKLKRKITPSSPTSPLYLKGDKYKN